MARNRGVTTPANIPGVSIPVVSEFELTPEKPSFLDQLKSQYGENLEYTNISLYRLDKNNPTKKGIFMMKYEQPPEIYQVQEDHGGGYYELWVQWNDPAADGSRKFWKTKFEIAGPAKQYDPDKKQVQQSAPSKSDMLSEIKMYKDIFGTGEGKSELGNVIMFMMQMSKSADEKMLKMFETLGKNNSNGINESILTTLLTAALQKANPLTDLTSIKEVIELVQGLSGSGTGESKSTLDHVLGMIPAILGPKRGPTMPVNGSMAPVRQLPGPDPNTTLIQQMRAEIEQLRKELRYSNLSDDELDKFESGINTLGHEKNYAKCVSEGIITDITDYNEWIKICNNRNAENDDATVIPFYEPAAAVQENQNNISNMSSIVEILKNATPEVKIAQLKMYVANLGHEKTFNWCYENGVIDNSSYENALIAYNTWCRSAGIEEYKP